MTPSNNLPPELQSFSNLLDAQPENVREIFHYALVLMLVENGKGEIIERRTLDGREHVTIRTAAKEIFTIMKPAVSDKLLEKMRMQVREIMHEDRRRQTDD